LDLVHRVEFITQRSDNLTAARDAHGRADWLNARSVLEAALQQDDTPEAHDALGVALWWLNEQTLLTCSFAMLLARRMELISAHRRPVRHRR
jgi:hypothetical protein